MESHVLRRIPLALVLLGACLGSAIADDKPTPLSAENRDYDMVHLDLDVTLDWDSRSLTGKASHQLKSLKDGLDRVRMHLEDMQVKSVSVSGQPAKSFSTKGDELTMVLDRPRQKGEAFNLVIEYGGSPTSGLWFFRPTEENPQIPMQVWTQGQGTENRHWIPIYDLPDDRLTTSLTVTSPKGMTVLSNGVPSEDESDTDTDSGQQTQTWNLERPHPPYIITLVVGKFDVVKRDAAGIPQYDYVPPGWGKWADEVFGRTPDMMAFFQEYTGQKYPWKRYSQVTVWDFHWGGMENTGATTLNMRALHKEGIRPDYSADGLVAHELAHMWFGDLITCRTWNHIWLNEGFATYFTDLWVEHHHGADDFAYARRRSMDRYLDSVDLDAVSRRARPEKATDCGDVQGKPYVKGSSILHMLRHVIGDSDFSTGVKTYVKRARDQSVESEMLRHAMEEESGQDLSWFFEQWVYGSGVPRLAVKHAYDKDAGLVTITVEQTQPVTDVRPLFRTPVDVEISPANGETISRRFQLHSASHSWTVPLTEEPLSVTFDPGDWLVAKIEHTQTRAQWEEQLASGSHAIRRIRAARALGKQGVKAVAALAKSATQDAFHGVREEAAKALGKIGGKQAAEALIHVCSDKDSRVRTAALEALGSVPASWSADTLGEHALKDASVYAAAAAAESLGKVRAPSAFEVLTEAVKRESHRNVIRQRAMDGLRHLGDPRGARLAYGSLAYVHGQGVQHRLRHAALDAAVALAPHAPETQEWIVKLVLDPYFRMRNWAAGHAAKLGIEAAIPRLEESAKNGLGPGVRRAAKNALKKLRGPAKEVTEPK